jgi:hypothetical protein
MYTCRCVRTHVNVLICDVVPHKFGFGIRTYVYIYVYACNLFMCTYISVCMQFMYVCMQFADVYACDSLCSYAKNCFCTCVHLLFQALSICILVHTYLHILHTLGTYLDSTCIYYIHWAHTFHSFMPCDKRDSSIFILVHTYLHILHTLGTYLDSFMPCDDRDSFANMSGASSMCCWMSVCPTSLCKICM